MLELRPSCERCNKALARLASAFRAIAPGKPSIATRVARGVFLALSAAASAALADVRDTETERALSLKAGGPALVMPRGDWVLASERVRKDRLVVYYLLSSESAGVTFSVYINGARACEAVDRCLELALDNPGYEAARDIARVEAGGFKAAHFHIDRPMGADVQQANVVAAGLRDGVWFDMHLSAVGKQKPEVAPMLELLKGFSLR